MRPIQIIWSDEQGGNVEHLREHGISPGEAEAVVVRYFDERERSRSSDLWVVMGFTPAGRFLVVAFDYLPELAILIAVTAFEPESL